MTIERDSARTRRQLAHDGENDDGQDKRCGPRQRAFGGNLGQVVGKNFTTSERARDDCKSKGQRGREVAKGAIDSQPKRDHRSSATDAGKISRAFDAHDGKAPMGPQTCDGRGDGRVIVAVDV